MRGAMRQRSKGSWQLLFDIGRDETGRRIRKFITVMGNKKEAEKKLREFLLHLETGGYIEPSRETLGSFLLRWLNEYVKPNLSPKTFEGYEFMIRRHLIPSLGNILLTKLTPRRIQTYYSEKLSNGRIDGTQGLSPRTVRHHHRTLHDALQFAVRWGMVARNVTDAVDPPRFSPKEITVLEAEGAITLLKTAQGMDLYPLFHLALFTGMRRSELLALRWNHVDLNLLTVSVTQSLHQLRGGELVFREPKSKKSRRLVDLSPTNGIVLREWKKNLETHRLLLGRPLEQSDLVFQQPNGDPLRPDSVTHSFKKLAIKSGFPTLRLHDLRHSHATIMLQQGIHPKIVQERLGHASIQLTLDTYSHVVPGLQKAAALRFDEGLTQGNSLTGVPSDGAKMVPK